MAVIAVMKKKDDSRRFILTKFVDGVITMHEEGSDTIKEVKRKTFTKGYRLIEGSLDDIKGGTSSAPEVESKPAKQKFIRSVDIQKADGRDMRIVTAKLSDPEAGIAHINEADFIEELVNDHGAIHGDKVVTDGGVLGYINLNDNEPKFDMINPPLFDKNKATGEDGDTVTIEYVASGRKVTMTRREFYAKTHSVTLKERPVELELEVDPPPEIMADALTPSTHINSDVSPAHDNKPPLAWNLQPTESKPLTATEQADIEMARNSMRANRDAKIEDAKPFVPEPFFLRQSMISQYLQCPDKMYDIYENGYGEESIFTRVGTAIHGVMEDYYNGKHEGDIGKLFDEWWAKHAVPNWDWYRDWKELVTRYFEKEAKHERPNVIATELEFRTTINGVPVSGTIDRIDRVSERTIRLVDYKTNFRAFSGTELNESIQFMMYTAAIQTEELRQMLRDRGDSGEFEVVICTYEMLRLGYRQNVIFELEEMETFKGWLKTIWTMILSGVDRKPKLNQYCGHCQKRQRCSLYQEALNAPVSSILTENTNIEAIIEERERLTNNKKLIENRLSEIEEQIKTKIAENQGSLIVGEYEWNTKSGTRNTYPAADVFRILAMNGLGDLIPDLVNISNTALQKALKDRKDILEMIEQKKVTTYTAPSLNKRKLKSAEK